MKPPFSMIMILRKLKWNIARTSRHKSCSYSTFQRGLIMGIESSCDDTGCAVVDTEGNVLGEALNSQSLVHLNNGGIIPPIAQELHRNNIEGVVKAAIDQANIKFNDLNAIATTVKPGLPMSLEIGMKYGKHLCRLHQKPFIPIHHMEAHALTARMYDKTVDFPFLVLLISGGHCLLAVAQSVDRFLLLGTTLDDAPGEAFDKVARRMKLRNHPEYYELLGGQAIELAALKATDPFQFEFKIPMVHKKDCNFSMSGIKSQLYRHLFREEKKHDIPPDGIIPNVANLCAGFQYVVSRHLCHRVQRAMTYAGREGLITEDKQILVVSGGAASNNFIKSTLQLVCDEMGYRMVRPPPRLCTDNGIMIAWNGVERWKANLGIFGDFEDIGVEKQCPLGTDISQDVANKNISCKWVKLGKISHYN